MNPLPAQNSVSLAKVIKFHHTHATYRPIFSSYQRLDAEEWNQR